MQGWRIVLGLLAAGLAGAMLAAAETVDLIDPTKPAAGWSFGNGPEFPGAEGGLTEDAAVEPQRRPALRLDADFTGGGNYVQLGRELPAKEIEALSFWLKAPAGQTELTLRLIDATDQCHQINYRIDPAGQWQPVNFPVARYFAQAGTSASVEAVVRYEGWGGAGDGKWHNPVKALYLLTGSMAYGEAKKGSTWLSGVKLLVASSGQAYRESFDAAPALPAGWTGTGPAGAVTLVRAGAFEGPNALRVARTEDQLNTEVQVTGAPFAAAPGPWRVGGALRSDLHSPDNSFAMRLNLDALDAAGGQLERLTLVDQTGRQNWKPFTRQIELPAGTAQARFGLTVHKTYGTCDVDALSAAPLAAERREKLVNRIVIRSGAVGNMFYPDDEVKLTVEVQTEKPLPPDGRRIQAVVTDYWGAEQFPARTLELAPDGQAGQRFRYGSSLGLPRDQLELGKYYELHLQLDVAGYESAGEYSAFVRLPEAESRRYQPAQIPFTIRSWDCRIPDYMRLASRLGHRNLGVWGGWDAKDPRQVWVPTLELCRELGASWVTGTPAADVEHHGFQNYSPENLRAGMTNFLKTYAGQGLAYICQGNEPPEKPALVAEKVKAYRAIYEAVKAFDPRLQVIATSVGANRDFFAAGYHNYCDIYDFHVYETYENVRQGVRAYQALMQEYHAPKPIFCTELGLNSQGQTRQAVAQELVKKITVFFAAGGANVSWFGIMYPDDEGKARGTSGDAHNVFDCKYSQYNPRLDAIMYYQLINGLTIKKFAAEVQHEDGVQDFLFRDPAGECLQVLWHEGGRVDRGLRLPGTPEARLIRIDGSSARLTPEQGVVTLALSPEPVLLRYRSEARAPARELAPPALAVAEANLAILKGKSRDLRVTGPGLSPETLAVQLPPRWTLSLKPDGPDAVVCSIGAPELTAARTGRVLIQRQAGAGIAGELCLPFAILSPVAVEILAAPRNEAGEPGLRVELSNHGTQAKPLGWTVELTESWPMAGGTYQLQSPQPVAAYLKGETEGQATFAPGATRSLKLWIAASDPLTIYRVRVNLTDEVGRKVTRQRLVGGFATAARANAAPQIDGRLDDAAWGRAPVWPINEKRQVFALQPDSPEWRGPADLSAKWRAAWDADHLYLAVEVTDDVHRVQFADGAIWNQDGLQFLFDPARPQPEKSGKYDYSVGAGPKGPQAWCHLTASTAAPEGEAKEIKLAVADLPGSPGGKIYELAIPWSRLAPFEPEVGADLGLALILNEDDGEGRKGFMGWLSGVHSKQLDLAGDLILTE